ncbi:MULTISPECIES: TonB-dependent receptor [unclassified Campylobacter]|uniref:TonB-dependent receptor domain-containing protein n=1 Tax=unclassified Campylobacter TaxID=2593542 RepID=UPI0014735DB1
MIKNSLILSIAVCVSCYGADSLRLDEVTITAQKTDETAIDVPVSMGILSGNDLDDRQINKLENITNLTSNLSIFNASGIVSPNIRGIASNTALQNLNVGLYVDGVSYLGTLGNNLFLEDIERIEVLKGPQSILYGKNAYAGAINIVSKEPTNDLESKIGLKLGSDNLKGLNFSAGGAIVEDKFLARLNGFSRRKDGFVYNEYLNKTDDYEKTNFAKLYLKFKPTESLNLDLIQSLYNSKIGAPAMNLSNAKDLRKVSNNIEGKGNLKNYENSLKLSYKFKDYEFTSLSTFRNYKDNRIYDGDNTPASMIGVRSSHFQKDYSQEFRFVADKDYGKFLAGIQGSISDVKKRIIINDVMLYSDTKTKTKGYGFFSHNDFYITPAFTLILGMRFDKDEARLKHHLLADDKKDTYNAFSPKLGLKYKINENFMSYISVSKGYKAGGYLFSAPIDKMWYDKETLINYEWGFKTTWDKFDLSGAVFYADIKDKQVMTAVTPLLSYAANAAKAKSQGFELEGNYFMSDSLKFNASLGYAKSVYKTFKDAKGDYKGKYVNYAPEWTYTIGVDYYSGGGFFWGAYLRGQSKMYSDENNIYSSKGYMLIDAKIGYDSKNIGIYLYANNIFDKKHDTNYGAYTFMSEPREVGVKFEYKF